MGGASLVQTGVSKPGGPKWYHRRSNAGPSPLFHPRRAVPLSLIGQHALRPEPQAPNGRELATLSMFRPMSLAYARDNRI